MIAIRDTLGNHRSPVSEDELKALIEFSSDGFWTQGSGDLAIKIDENGLTKSMVIVKKPGFGFMLNIFDGGDQMIAVSSMDYEQTTVTSIGGEPWEVPVAFFIDPKRALGAVIHFYREGGQTGEIEWVDFYEQSWTNKLS